MSDFSPKRWTQRQFTEALKKQIKKQGLIDTGALYESIDCTVSIDEFGVMTVDVYAMDYIKYLWFPYSLDKFVYTGNFIWTSYAQWTDYKTKQQPIINWKVDNPRIVFNLPD